MIFSSLLVAISFWLKIDEKFSSLVTAAKTLQGRAVKRENWLKNPKFS
jgi:hypothetical protein